MPERQKSYKKINRMNTAIYDFRKLVSERRILEGDMK